MPSIESVSTSRRISGCCGLQMPLAATLTALFALSPSTIANTLIVSNCNDTGLGSLRSEVAAAATGSMAFDTVQFNLPAACNSTITLTTGAIQIPQTNLNIAGPGPTNRVTITGNNNGTVEQDRIFNHTGTGTLNVSNLDIMYGAPYSATADVSGGCISSLGKVTLEYARVTRCLALANRNYYAFGGGIRTAGDLVLAYDSVVTYNQAGPSPSDIRPGALVAYGGGVSVAGKLYTNFATIAHNVAYGTMGASGGGASVAGSVSMRYSTIADNRSWGSEGGLASFGTAANAMTDIRFSTISGNTADSFVGGIFSGAAKTSIRGSTIAFNRAGGVKSGSQYFAPGLTVSGGGASTVTLYNALLSNNITVAGIENDFSVLNAGATMVGSNNLVHVATAPLPSNALLTGCPLLGPLRNNGGITLTHALMSHSPAIDAGFDDTDIAINDQRNLPRPSPAGGRVDIGAYEVQKNDIVFNSGFDGCP